MNNIKTFRDGDRFVLVVENCKGSLAAKVNEIIVSLVGVEDEPIEVPLVPIKVEEENVPDVTSYEEVYQFLDTEKKIDPDVFRFVAGNYKGLTFEEAQKKDGNKAVAYTFAHVKEVAPNCQEQIRCKCKEIMFYDYGLGNYNPDLDSENDFRKFIDTYDSILDKTFKSISAQAGYENIQALIANARENVWRDAYSAAKKKLIDLLS